MKHNDRDTGSRAAPDQADAAEAVATASWLVRDYIRDLKELRGRLDHGAADQMAPADLKKITDTAKTMRQAIHMLMEERGRIESYRKNFAGDGAAGMDLCAARDEIGRRLACLRRTRAG